MQAQSPSILLLAYYLTRDDPRLSRQVRLLRSARQETQIKVAGIYGQQLACADSCVIVSAELPRRRTWLAPFLARWERISALHCLNEKRWHAIIASDPETLIIAANLAARHNAALFYDAHEFYEDVAGGSEGRTSWVRRVHERYLPMTRHFFVPSTAIADRYAHLYPAAPRADVLANAAAHKRSSNVDSRLRSQCGASPSDRILVYHGSTGAERGLNELISLFEGGGVPGWKLALVTSDFGIEMQRRISACRDITHTKRVPQEELADYLSGADAGIVPYALTCFNHDAALPNKLWDFGAAGLPCFVTPAREMSTIVRMFDNGFILPADAAKWGAFIASTSPEALTAAGRAASRFFSDPQWAEQGRIFASKVLAAAACSSVETGA
jgi:glycosyltransferase involved in cell wall biosynthesis